MSLSSPRPLKRSASVASLPTPPPTKRKRKYGGSKRSDDGFSATEATDEDEDETHDKLVREAEAEENFWSSKNYASTSRRESPPLLYKRLQQAQTSTHVLPVSPPPSHRKPPPGRPAVVFQTPPPKSTKSACSSAASPPITPPPKQRDAIPRDSPDNPFLASPLGSQDEGFVQSDKTSALPEEKPTMAFVFRGMRRSFPNPHYKADGSSDPNPNSQLPPEHPDFEPDERGVRKLLFGVRRKTAGAQKSGSQSRRAAEAARGRRTTAKSDEAAA